MHMERPGYLKRTQETRIDGKPSNVLTASPKTVTGQRSNQYCYRSLGLGVISNVSVEDMETSVVAIHKRGRGLDCCSRISGIGRFLCLEPSDPLRHYLELDIFALACLNLLEDVSNERLPARSDT